MLVLFTRKDWYMYDQPKLHVSYSTCIWVFGSIGIVMRTESPGEVTSEHLHPDASGTPWVDLLGINNIELFSLVDSIENHSRL